MELDLTCLAAFQAKARSRSSDSVGSRFDLVSHDDVSTGMSSTACSIAPPETLRTSNPSAGPHAGATRSTRACLRLFSTSRASGSKSGAITTCRARPHGPGRGCRQRSVERHYSAVRRHRVALVGLPVGLRLVLVYGESARVIVLDDRRGGLREVGHDPPGGLAVEDVVEGDFRP